MFLVFSIHEVKSSCQCFRQRCIKSSILKLDPWFWSDLQYLEYKAARTSVEDGSKTLSIQDVFIVETVCYQWICNFVQIMLGRSWQSNCAAPTESCQHPHLIILHDLTCNSCLVLLFDLLFSACSYHPSSQLAVTTPWN